jgi:hypothetical protein
VRWCANPAEPCRTSTLHHCVCVEYPRRGECCALIGSPPRTSRRTDRPCCMRTPDRARVQGRSRGCNRYRGARVQRLEVLVAVMLARERRWPADTVADGYTELAAALATLPSGLLEMVADAVVALGCDVGRRVRDSKALAMPLSAGRRRRCAMASAFPLAGLESPTQDRNPHCRSAGTAKAGGQCLIPIGSI